MDGTSLHHATLNLDQGKLGKVPGMILWGETGFPKPCGQIRHGESTIFGTRIAVDNTISVGSPSTLAFRPHRLGLG